MKISFAEKPLLEIFGVYIFNIRWLLVPMYLGLYLALGAYLLKFIEETVHIAWTFDSSDENALLLAVIGLIDIIMVANLVVMIAIGGYSVFIREYGENELNNTPRWMVSKISSSSQKIKMGMSLIGVSMVHLLSSFMKADSISWPQLEKECLVLAFFLVGTYGMCMIDGQLHHNEHDGAK